MARALLPHLGLICALGVLFVLPAASADDIKTFELIVKDHSFQPKKLILPAGERVRLVIKNQDPKPMEFESYDLGREQIVFGNESATVYLGPLEPGSYAFFDEFRRDSTAGTVVAKPQP
ncbi:MAG: cupredoxin domain-containing protein [Sinobacteraceae bacterium]|nr:cupredoxin domain-containing protein [Nevskiaceae bacterium]